MSSEMIAWEPGMDYGVGIDALSDGIKGDGVVRTPPEEVTGSEGQRTYYSILRIETIDDFYKIMNSSAKASLNVGFAKASGKMSLMEEVSFHQYSIFLMVKVEVENSHRRMRDVQLKPAALELLKNGKVDRFREQYGDQFVLGMQTGGEFFGVLRIDTTDETNKESISAQLKASYGIGGTFSAKAQFSESITEIHKKNSVQITVLQMGGDTSSQPDTPEEMIVRASGFAESVKGEQSIPYSVLLADYRTLDIPDLPNWIDLQNQREALEDLADKKNKAMLLRNNIDYILLHADEFVQPDINALNSARDQLNDQINSMVDAASRCFNNIQECSFTDFTIPPAAANLPKRKPPKRTSSTISATASLSREALAKKLQRSVNDRSVKNIKHLGEHVP